MNDFFIELSAFREFLYHIKEKHQNHEQIQQLAKTYTCFQEKPEPRWNKHFHPKSISKKTERPKLAISQTVPPEAREFKTLLNKITIQNKDNVLRKARLLSKKEHIPTFVKIVYQYLKYQPTFHELYFSMLHVFSSEDMTVIKSEWDTHWSSYINNEEWILDTLIDQDDYDALCLYLKNKSRITAMSQAWGNLSKYGYIDISPDDWFDRLFLHATSLTVYDTFDCYIDQMREFYKTLSDTHKKMIYDTYLPKLCDCKSLPLPKLSYFKLLDFIELLSNDGLQTNHTRGTQHS